MRSLATRKEVYDAILDAADRLLARYGYKKMTMDDLAQEARIGKGTIYLHFPSKEEVALGRIDRVIARLIEQLREIAEGSTSADKKIRNMLMLRVLYRFDQAQHYSQSINDLLAALRPALLARREQHFQQEAEIFAAVLEEGKEAQLFKFDDTRRTARALLLATNSLLPYSLSTQELGRREEIEEKISGIAALLIKGLQ
jgi:TetR/AcrR family fatty acid metabolism transcriptional regulator